MWLRSSAGRSFKQVWLVIVLGIVAAFSTSCSHSTVRIPNLVGMSQGVAESALTKLGLKWQIIDQTHATPARPTAPRTVVAQRPTSGASIESGGKVVLVVYLEDGNH